MDPPPNLYQRNQQQPNNDWGNMDDNWDQPPQMDFGYQAPQQSRHGNNQQNHQQQPPYNPGYANGNQNYNYNPYQKSNFADSYSQPQAQPYGQYADQFMNTMGMSAPMVDAARSYGEQFARQQTEKFQAAISATHLKYYFQVDNLYVGKKLGLLLFPFAHQDWSLTYASENEPVPPKMDVNAPDLYIPIMAVVTYIMVAGLLLGTHSKFTPEELGLIASNVAAWMICENLLLMVTKYIMNIAQSLGVWTSLAFSTYKFVGMTICLAVYMSFGKSVYYWTLIYCAFTVAFFLIRSVKSFVMDSIYHSGEASKRKLYLIAYIALTQPFVMWWLTSSVIAVALGPRSAWSLFGSTVQKSNKVLPPGLEDIPEDMLLADGVI